MLSATSVANFNLLRRAHYERDLIAAPSRINATGEAIILLLATTDDGVQVLVTPLGILLRVGKDPAFVSNGAATPSARGTRGAQQLRTGCLSLSDGRTTYLYCPKCEATGPWLLH
jgi:hypothetical protein